MEEKKNLNFSYGVFISGEKKISNNNNNNKIKNISKMKENIYMEEFSC